MPRMRGADPRKLTCPNKMDFTPESKVAPENHVLKIKHLSHCTGWKTIRFQNPVRYNAKFLTWHASLRFVRFAMT